MSKSSTSFQPKSGPVARAAMVNLYKNGPQPLSGLGVTYNTAAKMRDQGLLKVKGQIMTGKQGRPAHVFGLTDKGRKRAKRAA